MRNVPARAHWDMAGQQRSSLGKVVCTGIHITMHRRRAVLRGQERTGSKDMPKTSHANGERHLSVCRSVNFRFWEE